MNHQTGNKRSTSNLNTTMKAISSKVTALFAVVLFSIMTLSSFASGSPDTMAATNAAKSTSVQIYKGMNQNTFRFAVQNAEPAAIQIEIRNAENKLIYWQNVGEKTTYTELYNMASLPTGTYSVTFNTNDTSFTKLVTVK